MMNNPRNIVLVFAGGSGIRMNNAAKPKQFLRLHGKEIIVHTLENFETHREIDAIAVVCIESWMPYFYELVEKYKLIKVRWVVPGGTNGQESIYQGLKVIKEHCRDNPVVLIHDGVRPLISADLISRCIKSVLEYGSGVTVVSAIETIVSLNQNGKIDAITDRSQCFHAKAPQCFRLKDIFDAHEKALAEGLTNVIDSASLMHNYGYELYTVQGSYENIKITTPEDFYIFRALYEVKENSQIFGI